MPRLKFKNCDYDCNDMRDKRGTFRVYCRRVDKKCKISSLSKAGLSAIEQRYAPIIQKVTTQYPKHLIHGRQFFIVNGGALPSIPSIAELKRHKEVISVHSHSAMNWEKYTAKHGPEEFEPFSDGDVDNLRKGFKNGWLKGMIVIMADGRMDWLSLSPKAVGERYVTFLRLGPKTIARQLELSMGERISTGDYPFVRQKLRAFAQKYGLDFKEGLHWR